MLFGRAAALERLEAAVTNPDVRWVSVVGLGGVGKSSLVLEWLEHHSDLAPAFCRLDHAGAAALPLALSTALGARERTLDGLAAALAGAGPTLLILDGAEVLGEDDRHALDDWSASLDSLRVIATSRWPLQVTNEHLIRLAPLALPRDGAHEDARESPAVAMLLERIERLGPHEPPQLAAVVALARALGGLPLGLELCARTAALLGPAEALARLGDMVALPDPKRLESDRQVSLQRVLDTTWDECPTWVRSGLAQASIFETAFTLRAAEAVLELPESASVLGLIHELLDRSLLQVEPTAAAGSERRFRLHDLIRHAAAVRREDEAALRRRHEQYFLNGLAQERLDDAFPDAASQRRQLLDAPDILTACAAVRADPEAEPERLTRVAIVARSFFLGGVRLPDLDALVERVIRPEVLHALGAAGASSIAELVGVLRSWERSDDAEAWLKRAVQLAEESGDPALRFGTLMRQAHQHLGVAETREARDTVDAMRALLPALPEPKWTGWVMALSALVERHRAEVPWLEAQLREAGRILAEAEAPDASLAWIQVRLADILVDAGRPEDGLGGALEAAELARANPQLRAYARLIEVLARLGSDDLDGATDAAQALEESASDDESTRRLAMVARASVHLCRQRWSEAMVAFEVLDELPVESGDDGSVATVHLGLAVAAAHAGAPERAREALAEAETRIAGDSTGPFARVLARCRAMVEGRRLGEMPRLRPTRMPTVAAVLHVISKAAESGHDPTLEVGLDGAWARWAGSPPLSMTRRPVLQRLLVALVEHRETDPGATLSTDELFERGWPGETIDVGSARNRTRVALARLRKLGLDAAIERLPDGVRIPPMVTVVRAGTNTPSDC